MSTKTMMMKKKVVTVVRTVEEQYIAERKKTSGKSAAGKKEPKKAIKPASAKQAEGKKAKAIKPGIYGILPFTLDTLDAPRCMYFMLPWKIDPSQMLSA